MQEMVSTTTRCQGHAHKMSPTLRPAVTWASLECGHSRCQGPPLRVQEDVQSLLVSGTVWDFVVVNVACGFLAVTGIATSKQASL